jgi:hypothetical protein
MGARLGHHRTPVHSRRKAAWRRSQQVGGAADGRQIVWPEVVLWLSRLADIVRGEQLEPHSSGHVIHAEPGELLGSEVIQLAPRNLAAHLAPLDRRGGVST